MKNILVAVVVLGLFSCDRSETHKRSYILTKSDDNGWSMGARIMCDSVTMVSETEAIYWVDGIESKLIGKRINIYSND